MKMFLGVIVAMAFVAAGATVAEAGWPYSGSHYGYNRGYYGGHGGGIQVSYYGGGGLGLPGVNYGGRGGHHGHHGHHSWHDTSHYDFHPGGLVPHYDHYDYVPSHYDWHQEGHWDHH